MGEKSFGNLCMASVIDLSKIKEIPDDPIYCNACGRKLYHYVDISINIQPRVVHTTSFWDMDEYRIDHREYPRICEECLRNMLNCVEGNITVRLLNRFKQFSDKLMRRQHD
jgi:hypothetical protein